MDTAHFAFAAYNPSSDAREIVVKVQPVTDKRTLKALSYGPLQALLERRNMAFGKLTEISVGFGSERGPYTLPQVPELLVDPETLRAHAGSEDGVALEQVDGTRVPRLPVRRLGHLPADEAERLVVPRAQLSREQRARLQERGEINENVRFARFARGDEFDVELPAEYMQQLILQVRGVTDPQRAYPAKVAQYVRGNDQPMEVFYVVFVRRFDATLKDD